MTWLYVPKTSSAYAPEGADLTSPSSWRCQLLERSAWWRGKPSRSAIWSARCKRVSWMNALCGVMSPPSTAGLGVERWIGSLAASRASLTAQPESGLDAKTNATSGQTLGGYSFSRGRAESSSRTSRECSQRAGQSGSIVTWSALVASLRSDYSARQKSASRIAATGLSSSGSDQASAWPTPAARDHKGSGPATTRADGKTRIDMLDYAAERFWRTPTDDSRRGGAANPQDRKDQGHTVNLQDQASYWATPTAKHNPRGKGDRNNPAGGGGCLATDAMEATQLWSTPRATDGEKGGPNQTFGAGGTPLPAQIAQWATPRANDAEKRGDIAGDPRNGLPGMTAHWQTPAVGMVTGGQASRSGARANEPMINGQAEMVSRYHHPDLETQTHGEPSSKAARSLNPLFVEWLMSWPIGWTGSECAATEFTRWQSRMESALSSLDCAPAPAVQASLL